MSGAGITTEQTLAHLLKEYVVSNPFNNLALVLSYLNFLKSEGAGDTIEETMRRWPLKSDALPEEEGGTNCVGASLIMREQLNQHGIPSSLLFSENFAFCADIVPFSHVALLVEAEEGTGYIVDPGLGLVEPIPVDPNQTIDIAGRLYKVAMVGDHPTLIITKPDATQLHFRFTPDVGEEIDVEEHVQKPLFRATSSFKIDTFDSEGNKKTSLKVDYMNRRLDYYLGGQYNSVDFDKVERFFDTPEFAELSQSFEEPRLEEKVRQALAGQESIINVWFEELQRQYYLEHPHLLSPFETTWQELADRGYNGGGVVVCLVNERDEVMLYEVPEGKAKPFLGRYPGQWNLFIETADPTVEGGGVAELEDFRINLERAFAEEVGLPVPDDFVYREVDYRPNVRARCVICRVNSSDIDLMTAHMQARHERLGKVELGQLNWVPVTELSSRWLEPNAQPILEKCIAAGLLPRPEVTFDETDEADIS